MTGWSFCPTQAAMVVMIDSRLCGRSTHQLIASHPAVSYHSRRLVSGRGSDCNRLLHRTLSGWSLHAVSDRQQLQLSQCCKLTFRQIYGLICRFLENGRQISSCRQYTARLWERYLWSKFCILYTRFYCNIQETHLWLLQSLLLKASAGPCLCR